MAKQQRKSRNDPVILLAVMILAVGSIIFLISTDVFTLFTTSSLTLDHTGNRATPDQRGADGLTGQFRAEANFADFLERFRDRLQDFLNQFENRRLRFETPVTPDPPMCTTQCSQPPPAPLPPIPEEIPTFGSPPTPVVTVEHGTTVSILDLRDGSVIDSILVNGVKGGGGQASSTTPAGGVPELIRNKVVVHERFHTPANGQSTSGSILLEWGHGESITVQQFLVPNEYFDWFEFELPQTIRGDGVATFDGISEGEFFYKLTIPDDLINADTVIPIRMIINTQQSVVDAVTEIQIERPVELSEQFSVAEFFRSIFTEIREEFA